MPDKGARQAALLVPPEGGSRIGIVDGTHALREPGVAASSPVQDVFTAIGWSQKDRASRAHFTGARTNVRAAESWS